MSTVEEPLDVVIKTRVADVAPFQQLQADLAAHSRLRGRVYVIVPRDERKEFVDVVANGNILLTSEDVAAAASYDGEFPDTWFTQQIVKIVAANVTENRYYLILDSNTLIGFDFDERHFLSGGKYVYAVNDFRDVAWELQSRNFLGLHAPSRLAGFRAANQIFSKQNVQALIRYVEGFYKENAVGVLLKYCDELSTAFWTEFALYGAFVQSLQNGTGHCFEERFDLFHFSERRNFAHFLDDIAMQRPLMVKLNKTRPGQYELGSSEYAGRVSDIKRAYRHRLKERVAP